MFRALRYLAVTALIGAALVSCEDENTTVQPTPTGTVTVHLDETVGGEPLVLDTLLYTNSSGTPYEVTKLVYVVSEVTLHRSNGQTFGMDGIHYRDHGNDETRSFTLSGVPTGTYDMVSFTFGLDDIRNVKDRYLNYPYDFQSEMEWPDPLGGSNGLGYHYMKLEGFYESADTLATILTHTGARWCDADCGPDPTGPDLYPRHHFFRVHLDLDPVSIGDGVFDLDVEMDINRWWEDNPDDQFDSTYDWPDLPAATIMADLEAQQKLMINGPRCFSAAIAPSP